MGHPVPCPGPGLPEETSYARKQHDTNRLHRLPVPLVSAEGT